MVGYRKESREVTKKRLALNKSRARQMETRVTKFLGDSSYRVPMSGSGVIKGDGLVYTMRGLVLLECKFTSLASDLRKSPYFYCRTDVINKLRKDMKSMRAVSGLLIFHFLNYKDDYAVILPEGFDFWGYLPKESKKKGSTVSARLSKTAIDKILKEEYQYDFTLNEEHFIVVKLSEIKDKVEEFNRGMFHE